VDFRKDVETPLGWGLEKKEREARCGRAVPGTKERERRLETVGKGTAKNA